MSTERRLLLAVVLAELLHTVVAAAQHRVPLSHDGFQYFTLQYFFLNNALQAHQVAQWLPYMNQGTIATLWYGIQAGLLQSVLVHLPLLPHYADLLPVYHVGMFVDEMVLLTGTWFLARRFFGAHTVLFVAISVIGASVWLDQPYWNFKLHYAIPLILELGHRFLDTGRWRWCFLMINLLAVQMIGNLPYLIPLTSFVVAAYFAAYGAANPRLFWQQLCALRWGRQALLAVAGGVLSLAAAYLCFTVGVDQLVSHNAYRNADGTNPLAVFLTYGGTSLPAWIDMVLNLSPWLDMTLYSGMLVLPLLLLAVFVIDRRRLHFLIVALTLLLFTLGTFVSAALFYLWPGMKYFRHIGLVSPLVRVFWCFVAGIAFEWLCERPPGRHTLARQVAGASLAVLLGFIALFAFRLSLNHQAMMALVDHISNPGISRPAHVQFADVLARRLWISTVLAILAAITVGFGAVVFNAGRLSPNRRARQAWLWAVLMLVAVDVYHFKFAYLFARSDVIPASARFVTQSSRMTYPERREIDLKNVAVHRSNPRLNATMAFSPMFMMRLQGRASLGAQYWTNNLFVFADEAGSTFQVDSWLKPLDQLIRLYWHVSLNDPSGFPPGVDLRQFRFPLSHVAAGRISGVTEDKIRFFAHAYTVNAADDLPALMADERYAGNILFLLPLTERTHATRATVMWDAQEPLSGDDSRPLSYHVDGFDANNLSVSVSNPGSASWLVYSDVWHPLWRATVNGRTVPVYRANLAYKAVPIEAGENVVHFEFGSRWLSGLSGILALNAAFWLAMVAYMVWGYLK